MAANKAAPSDLTNSRLYPTGYIMMMSIRTAVFAEWFRSLRDDRAKAKVAVRIDRLSLGNPGDVKPVGAGVSEMRIDYGPGYRVYFAQHNEMLIVLLSGGTKRSQQADISEAKRLFSEWKKART